MRDQTFYVISTEYRVNKGTEPQMGQFHKCLSDCSLRSSTVKMRLRAVLLARFSITQLHQRASQVKEKKELLFRDAQTADNENQIFNKLRQACPE